MDGSMDNHPWQKEREYKKKLLRFDSITRKKLKPLATLLQGQRYSKRGTMLWPYGSIYGAIIGIILIGGHMCNGEEYVYSI